MSMEILTDQFLLDVCRVTYQDDEITPEFCSDLQAIVPLVGDQWPPSSEHLEYAVTLLASALCQLRRYHPRHLPLGYTGPTIQSVGWMDRNDLDNLAKQITGMAWGNANPRIVATTVSVAITNAVELGFLEERQYDAWRPGMDSGSGWRAALTVTPYGLNRARHVAESLATSVPAVLAKHQTEMAAVPEKPVPKQISNVSAKDVSVGAPIMTTTPTEEIGTWMVGGVLKKLRTKAQRDIIQVLHAAGAAGLSSDELDRKSGHTDARKILGRLAKKDLGWQSVIVLPGNSHGRYRIN